MLGWLMVVLASCSGGPSDPPVSPAAPLARAARAGTVGNVLVLVADDLSTTFVGAYQTGTHPPPTPHIDALARRGVLFRNAYSSPACTASRSAALTGRHGRRTGLSVHLEAESSWGLPLEEVTIPEVLERADQDWSSIALGKWHLTGVPHLAATHPHDQGFDDFSGSLFNPRTYVDWPRVTNGVETTEAVYSTTALVDAALDRIAARPDPWFMWLSFYAPHLPVHVPPAHLHTQTVDDASTVPQLYRAMVESLDTEIGRLLGSIDPTVLARTTVIFIGDNGTYKEAFDFAITPDRAKGSLAEQGTRVPWIVAGPGVVAPGRETPALAHLVDLLPTVAEVAGVDTSGLVLDGVSLFDVLADPAAPGRRTEVVTEWFGPNGAPPYTDRDQIAVRGARYKLWTNAVTGTERMYDLRGRYDDGPPLKPGALDSAERSALDQLRAATLRHRRDVVFAH